ncbi:hypothetical protein SteCoe_10009 [Stentor coeruleus]|uniref:Calmodulin n=1 Tax=Stentor coeruleus TaxID=5963 RepID=A0A1R2CGN9_9CILI|nr:hypothetical protein SteCoe_10009 [Stentor coeruleus]
MLNLETEKRLARLLFQIAECERSIERSRQNICSNPNFDMYSIFRILDSQTNGKLEIGDLKAFLSREGISLLRSNLALVIRQYDSNNDGKLSLEEFQALVLPSEDLELRRVVLSRNIYTVNAYTENSVARHIELEAGYQVQLETLKKNLTSRADFNPIDAFRTIDANKLNFINVYEIRDFLRRNGYSITIQDIYGIIRRIDTDNDSKINYEDFTASVLPCKKERPQSAPRKTLNNSSLKKTSNNSSLRKTSKTSHNKSNFSSPNKSQSKQINQKIMYRSMRSKLFTYVPYDDMKYIVNTFAAQIRLDLDIERERIILAKKSEFTLTEFFRVFDVNNKNYITTTDIEDLLQYLRIPYDIDEVYLLIRHYSSYKDSIIRFSDFERMYMPRDKYFAQILKNKKTVIVPPYNRLTFFSSETIDQIIKILRLQMQSEILAENLRKNLINKKWINFYEVFEEIDKDRDGMISIGEFQDIFIQHGESPSITELEMLVERYDKDFNRRVSYCEFIEEITPKLFN